MAKFRNLFENFISLKDLVDISKNWNISKHQKFNLDFYLKKENKKYAIDVISLINKILDVVHIHMKVYKGLFFDDKQILKSLLDYDDLEINLKDNFPVLIYVASNKNDKNKIGLLLHFNGKLEMFEGNEEASIETWSLVNKALNIVKKKIVKIYGSHGNDIIDYIKKNKKLPVNLYVSPNREHASEYWGDNRILFTGNIDMNDVNQESDIDWKTNKETNIEGFRLI